METRNLIELLKVTLKEAETKGFNKGGICGLIVDMYIAQSINDLELGLLTRFLNKTGEEFPEESRNKLW